MYKINGPGATGDGHFTEGNPVGGIPATVVTDDFMNDVQDELLNILAAAGVTPAINTPTQVLASLAILSGGHGRCRLSVVSGTQLKLSPLNGNTIVVNGNVLRIPAAGITLANTGLANATVYYIYLSGTTAAPVLEASTTGHSTHTNGVEIKTGDATRTLVGMISTPVGANTFVDSVTQRYCLNWFNRRPLHQVLRNGGYSVTTGQEVGATAFRISFLNWADEPITAVFDGQAAGNTAASRGDCYLQLDFDSSTQTAGFSTIPGATIHAAGYAIALVATGYAVPAEGVIHYLSAFSYVTTGTLTYSSVGLRNITRG